MNIIEFIIKKIIALFRGILPNKHFDKWLHFVLGGLLFLIVWLLAGIPVAFITTLTICVLKETYDLASYGKFCWLDLLAGMVIPIIGLIFYLQ